MTYDELEAQMTKLIEAYINDPDREVDDFLKPVALAAMIVSLPMDAAVVNGVGPLERQADMMIGTYRLSAAMTSLLAPIPIMELNQHFVPTAVTMRMSLSIRDIKELEAFCIVVEDDAHGHLAVLEKFATKDRADDFLMNHSNHYRLIRRAVVMMGKAISEIEDDKRQFGMWDRNLYMVAPKVGDEAVN